MIKLDDFSFCIALSLDSEDRKKNLETVMNYLNFHFIGHQIILSELSKEQKLKEFEKYPNVKYVYMISNDNFFNRQKALNLSIKNCDSNFIAHYDADVLFPPRQIEKSLELLKNGEYDIIYPYDGKFYDVPKEYHKQIKEINQLDFIDLQKCKLFNSWSVGGAVIFNKKIFIEGGMANENFRNLGFEDNELDCRFKKLGYRQARTSGVLYHLNHTRKDTAYDNNAFMEHNVQELFRINRMTKEQLFEEIKKWPWLQK